MSPFLDRNISERAAIVKENRACFNCLTIGHTSRTCRSKKTCSKPGCGRNHHVLLHDDNFQASSSQKTGFSAKCGVSSTEKSLLQIMPIEIKSHICSQRVLALWDSGSTVSLVLNSLARKLQLKGKPVSIVMETLGNVCKKQTHLFALELKDKNNEIVTFEAYGVDEISKDLYNTEEQKELFPEDLKFQEQIAAPIGLLLGLNVVQHHPVPVKRKDNFVLFENSFGKCVSGTSVAQLSQNTFTKINFIQTDITLEDFYNIENMGIECTPRCGNCKCGNCPVGSSEFSIKDKRELDMIEKGLTLKDKIWTAKYPWIKSPKQLPNNRHVAERMLMNTEARLMKDAAHAKTYQSQIEDMLERGVAKKLDDKDLNYDGPVHYISHHEVLKEESASTPCRIVFNASASYKSHVLNEYWAKGPDLLGNLLGILVKFREDFVAYLGDVKKMYHSIRIDPEDQQTHRFLWRDFKRDEKPQEYMMQVVSFGDRPAATIAQLALRKTADLAGEEYFQEKKVIYDSTYMDDIIDSVEDMKTAKDRSDQRTLKRFCRKVLSR